jgi:hypothetical protein
VGAALVVTALAWLWLVYAQIPDAGAEWPGPRGVPLLLGIVLLVLGVALVRLKPDPTYVASGFSRTDARGTRAPGTESGRELAVALATFGLLVLYAFLLDWAGFLIAAPLVIVLAMAGVLRMRRWLFIACFAVAFPLGCWVIFNVLLGIPLPR